AIEGVMADASSDREEEIIPAPGEAECDGQAGNQRLRRGTRCRNDLQRTALCDDVEPSVRSERHRRGGPQRPRVEVGGKTGGYMDPPGGRKVWRWGDWRRRRDRRRRGRGRVAGRRRRRRSRRGLATGNHDEG